MLANLLGCPHKRWRNGVYTCADGQRVQCDRRLSGIRNKRGISLLRNGIQYSPGTTLASVVCTVTSRDMAKVIRLSRSRSYALPRTATSVGENAFPRMRSLESVRLNAGIRVLGAKCFAESGIRRLVLPASVELVCPHAFSGCSSLEHADLSAARGLKVLGEGAFCSCRKPKRVLFSDGPETIGSKCFRESGLEQLTVPRVAKHIGDGAFSLCRSLRQVRFAGSSLETIGAEAFMSSGLEAFVAPPSLRRIGSLAFAGCGALKELRLNEGVQELGELCLQKTAIDGVELPPQLCVTREQLGLGTGSPRTVRLPGLAVVDGELVPRDAEKIVIPSSVRVLGSYAFVGCERLREVVFEPGSRLESIEKGCFQNCGLERIVVPRSVRSIGKEAFSGCRRLSSVRFEDGSRLSEVGSWAFYGTALGPENVEYPSTFGNSGDGQ